MPTSSRAKRLLASPTLRRGRQNVAPKSRGIAPGARAIAKAAQKAAGAAYKSHKRSQNELAAAWPEIVGTTLAKYTRPERYQPGTGLANNGILTVKVSGAFALDLQHMEPQIVDRVNGYYGYQAIARLKIVQGPIANADIKPARRARPLSASERAALESRMTGIDNEALRLTLTRLGAKILAEDGQD